MDTHRFFLGTWVVVAGVLAQGCTVGQSTEQGALGLACYANASCDPGLVCLADVCVRSQDDSIDRIVGHDAAIVGDDATIIEDPDAITDDPAPPCENGEVQACFSGPAEKKTVGQCREGQRTCTAHVWGRCENQVLPAKEICDGQDNDCDTEIDESLKRSCYTGPDGTKGNGVCHGGVASCDGGDWGECKGEVTPGDEICDGKDNDCDGKTDEGCDCLPGETKECGSDEGLCSKGLLTCQDSGEFGVCEGESTPDDEICDGEDNDCDTQIDEDDGLALCENGNTCAGSAGCRCGEGPPCSGSEQCLGGICADSNAICGPNCLIIESARQGPVGVTSGQMQVISAEYWPGWRFEVPAGTTFTAVAVGLHARGQEGASTNIFGAIVKLDGADDLPDPTDLSGPDVLGVARFSLPAAGPSAVVVGSLSVPLPPGWYAVVFGAGAHGASSSSAGGLPMNSDRIDSAQAPFSLRQSTGSAVNQTPGSRMFVEIKY